jgi:PKD repeat protein
MLLAVLGAAACAAIAFPVVGALAGPGFDLPDLVADPPERPQLAEYTYPNGTDALLLRFDGFVHNRGAGPLEMRGTSRSGADMTLVRQHARRTGGALEPLTPIPGHEATIRYESEDGHNHWHLKEVARYSLWNAARTAEVTPGLKVGFCLEDSQRRETHGPSGQVYSASANFCLQNQPNASAVTMGVSAGWRDVYGRHLAFQWVDISDVQPGAYRLAAEVDQDDVVQESNEVNNTRTFETEDSIVPGYLAQAVNAGEVPPGQASTITLASQTFVRPARPAWNEPGVTPGARRFRIASLPAHGTLRSGTTVLAAGSVVTSASVTYTPAAGYSGPDGFTYSAFDSTSDFPRQPATASVSLTVGDQAATSVAISGAPPTLQVGTSAQLTATVTNGPPDVTWSVDGIAGGNATVGTVSSSGLYRAPDAVPPGGSATVRATSTAAPSAFDEVTIGIEPAPDPEPSPGNLIANYSFETSTSNWGTLRATLAREAQAAAPHGGFVARVTRTSGSSFAIDDNAFSVPSTTPGRLYTATVWVKAATSASVGDTVRLRLRERTSGGTQVADVASPSTSLTTSWKQLLVTRTTSTTGGTLGVRVVHSNAGSGTAMFVDAFSLTADAGTPPPNQAPTASFTVSPSSPQAGQAVTFTDTSTDADGAIASRAWDTDNDGSFDDGTGTTASRTFASAGTYTVRLQVTDDDGAPATTTRQVTVGSAPPPNQAPTAAFTVSPASPQTGQSVTFTDTSTDGDGTIASRAWDTDNDGAYDDGTGTTASRTFTSAGTFTVGLRVVDDDGAPATTTRQVTVTGGTPPPPPPPGNLIANPSFEVNTSGWAGYQGSLAREVLSGAPDGSAVVRVTRSSGTYFTIDAGDNITSTSAVTYRATAWVKAASASSVGKPIQIKLRERSAGGTVIADVSSPAVNLSNSWQQLTVQRTTAAGNRLGVRLSHQSAAAGDAFHADAFTLVVQ